MKRDLINPIDPADVKPGQVVVGVMWRAPYQSVARVVLVDAASPVANLPELPKHPDRDCERNATPSKPSRLPLDLWGYILAGVIAGLINTALTRWLS